MSKAIQCFKIYQNTNLKAFKIIVVSVSTRKIKTFINILEKKFKDKVSFVNTNKRLIEINAITTSKSSAIEYILKKNNESKKDVAAIGDSPNDIPMFKKVSLPISVRTKNKEVIQASKYHIPKFKNAISVAINKYII
jgi:HAD superfamily hydrolase (TIGR01484 family)